MSEAYQKMMDNTFGEYYERFRELNALTPEDAVTMEELFADGRPLLANDRMHKMLSMGVVKRVGLNRYWLDEKRASDSKGVLRQRLLIIAIALILGLALGILKTKGLLPF